MSFTYPIIHLFNYLFIHSFIFGCVGSSLLRGLSLVAASGGYSSLQYTGFSLQWLLLLQSTGSRCVGLVAPWHVGSSWTSVQTRVPCTGRRVLNHCTTREVPIHLFKVYNSKEFLDSSSRITITTVNFRTLHHPKKKRYNL